MDDETSRSLMAVKRGRRSGQVRATILRYDVEVSSRKYGRDDRRKCERIERLVVGVGDDDVGAP